MASVKFHHHVITSQLACCFACRRLWAGNRHRAFCTPNSGTRGMSAKYEFRLLILFFVLRVSDCLTYTAAAEFRSRFYSSHYCVRHDVLLSARKRGSSAFASYTWSFYSLHHSPTASLPSTWGFSSHPSLDLLRSPRCDAPGCPSTIAKLLSALSYLVSPLRSSGFHRPGARYRANHGEPLRSLELQLLPSAQKHSSQWISFSSVLIPFGVRSLSLDERPLGAFP